MILKYTLFTLTVCVIPIVMIFRDLTYNNQIFNLIFDRIQSLNLNLVTNILSTGVFTHFLGSDESDDQKTAETLKPKEVIFTNELLKTYTGINGKTLYLSILGNVFDVSKAARYYGPGETYNCFTGRDGTRAFVTGDFTESGLRDDVDGLSLQELRSLNDWLKFYHKEYIYRGKLVGKYYDKNGKPTGYSHKVRLRIEEAERDEKDKNRYKLMFPPCNVEWTPEVGSRVWCSKASGGVERNWVGVPRKLYEPGAETFRCACINTSDQLQAISPEMGQIRSGNLVEYEDCHPKSTSCYVNN